MIPSMINAEVKYLARFEYKDKIRSGEIQDKFTQPLSGDFFSHLIKTGKKIPLSNVKLMLPTDTQKVFALGMNFDDQMPHRLYS